MCRAEESADDRACTETSSHGVVSVARLAIVVAGCAALVATAACRREATDSGQTLPGSSRPLLTHDWPHPREFRFDASRFAPPDPAKALVTTTSGLRAFVVAAPEDRTVRITAAVPLGRVLEQPGEAGASGFVVQALRRARSPEALDAMAANLRVEEHLDVTTISIEVLPEDWRPALEFVVHHLRTLAPDVAALAAYKTGPGFIRQTARLDDGTQFRPRVELERLLGGYPLAPTPPDLKLAPAAVRALLVRSLAANHVVLGIGGRVNPAEVRSALERPSSGWPVAPAAPIVAPIAVPASAAAPRAIDSPTLEGWVAIGRAIGPVSQPERAPLAVMSDVLGTRLNIAAREIRGLANRTVFELPEQANGAGLMRILTGGRHEAVAPLVKVCLDELRRLHDAAGALSDEEIQRAKGAVVLSAWQASLDGAAQSAATYAVETVRTGGTRDLLAWPAAINAVTREQVRAVATKYLDPKAFTTVVVGPLGQIGRARHPRWPATLEELGLRATTDH